jgi:GH15 family glucan-1,4-alpha-glucosidase
MDARRRLPLIGYGLIGNSRTVALDRISRMSRRFDFKIDPGIRHEELRIRSAIEEHGYNARLGSYVMAFESSQLDASVLVMPLVGYSRPDFSRSITAAGLP